MQKKILIVDDSKTIQNLMQQTLKLINYESIIAKNGLEALDALIANNINLVLLDVEMSVMDGISCIQNIRKLPEETKATIPVVAVTGNALELSRKEFKQLGFTDTLFKPIEFAKLDSMLKKYLQHSSLHP